MLNRSDPVNPLSDLPGEANENIDIPPVSFLEVKEAINSLKNNKATGSDNIPAELLKAGGEVVARKIYNLISKIWNDECLPRDWNKGIMIPLFKKGDKLMCKNYRGICLQSTCYKVLAKILLNRLEPFTNDIIGQYQGGFRKGKSTTDQIFTIRQVMEKMWEYNKNHLHLFIDFQQAYDSIHRPSLWHILKEFNIPSKLIKMLKICVEGSECTVQVENHRTNTFKVNSGLKQGCILSPLLFNLILEKVSKDVITSIHGVNLHVGNENHKINMCAYADDVDLIAETEQGIEIMLGSFKSISDRVGLMINEEKTKLMSVKREEQNLIPVNMHGLNK